MNNKIGRNDPCPCGSGKKYKKCHMGRESELPGGAVSGAPVRVDAIRPGKVSPMRVVPDHIVKPSYADDGVPKKARLKTCVKTPEEIEAYFVQSYGEWILLRPKVQGLTSVLYVLPVLAIVLALVLIGAKIRAGGTTGIDESSLTVSAPDTGSTLSARDREWLDKERGESERLSCCRSTVCRIPPFR